MSKLELTDDELLLLDGKCRPEIQSVVETVKLRRNSESEWAGLSPAQAEMVLKIVEYAKKNGKLRYQHESIHYCSMCGKSAGYAKYPRSGRYHTKGDSNLKKPLHFSGFDLSDDFIRVRGHVSLGGCRDCEAKIMPVLRSALADVKAELPPAVMGVPSKWKRWDVKECEKCKWKGPEHEMGMKDAIMGGRYHGACPKCGAANSIFMLQVRTATGEFVFTEQPQ